LVGSFLGAMVGMFIRQISNYSKMHFLMSPMAFVLGNLILCPFFLAIKIFVSPIDPVSQVLTVKHTVGASLHVYNMEDIAIIFSLALMIYFG